MTINTISTINTIDTSKPLELADGIPVTYEGRSTIFGFPIRVRYAGANRCYTATGVPYNSTLPNLRNVDPAARYAGKKLQTRAGTPAAFITVLPNGKVLFKLTYPGSLSAAGYVERNADGTVPSLAPAITPFGTRNIVRMDADDIVVVPDRVSTFRNVYADGTIGDTAHKAFATALEAIKTGKVRVAILEQVHEGAELVNAKLTPCTPRRRDGSKPFPKA